MVLTALTLCENITENMTKQPLSKKYTKRDVRKWRLGLQRYCSRNAIKSRADGYCMCGYMSYCCHCSLGSDYFACVKAIMKLCKERNIHIDFSDRDYKSLIDKLGFREDENRERKSSAE